MSLHQPLTAFEAKKKFPESEGWVHARFRMRSPAQLSEPAVIRLMQGDNDLNEIGYYRQSGQVLCGCVRKKP